MRLLVLVAMFLSESIYPKPSFSVSEVETGGDGEGDAQAKANTKNKGTGQTRKPRYKAEKQTDGTKATREMEERKSGRSKYRLNGQPLEVDTD